MLDNITNFCLENEPVLEGEGLERVAEIKPNMYTHACLRLCKGALWCIGI